MAGIVIDFSTKDFTTGFDALPEGEYLAQIEQAELRATKANDKDMIVVTYLVHEPTEFKGRKLWDNIVIGESTAWKIAAVMSGLGLPVKELKLTIEDDGKGKRSYGGLMLGKPDEQGKTPFLGFVLGNEENPEYNAPIVGATVKLTVTAEESTYQGNTRTQNRIKNVELVGKLPTASAVETDGNTGDRPKFV